MAGLTGTTGQRIMADVTLIRHYGDKAKRDPANGQGWPPVSDEEGQDKDQIGEKRRGQSL